MPKTRITAFRSLDLEPCSWNQILGSIFDGRSIENVYNLICAICYITSRIIFIMKEMSVEKCPMGEMSVGELSWGKYPRGNDRGDMIRGANSLDRPIVMHLEINYRM